MLIETYLPKYHFREFHSIKIISSSNDIYQKMITCDLNQSYLIRLLFRLSGNYHPFSVLTDITKIGFIKLDEKQGEEILYGILSNSPTFSGCEKINSSAAFKEKNSGHIIKGVINFRVINDSSLNKLITTETRVWCSSDKMKNGFRIYWFFVKPFSQLVRKLMLKQIKKLVEGK